MDKQRARQGEARTEIVEWLSTQGVGFVFTSYDIMVVTKSKFHQTTVSRVIRDMIDECYIERINRSRYRVVKIRQPFMPIVLDESDGENVPTPKETIDSDVFTAAALGESILEVIGKLKDENRQLWDMLERTTAERDGLQEKINEIKLAQKPSTYNMNEISGR